MSAPRLPMALVRWMVPGPSGETLAAEIERTYLRDCHARGPRRAWLSCWREALSPSLWTLRRELCSSPSPFLESTKPSFGDPLLSRLLNDFRLAVRTLAKRPAFTLTAIGLAIGIVGALALARLLESFVFGISTADPATFVLVAAGLMLVAFVASYLPARRAGRSDPLVSLRAE